MNNRYHSQWESARWHGWLITSSLAGKNSTIESPQELVSFPWEKRKDKFKEEEDEEQLQILLQEAREYNKKLMN